MNLESIKNWHQMDQTEALKIVEGWFRPDTCQICWLIERLEDSEGARLIAEQDRIRAELALEGKWGSNPMSDLLRKCADESGEVHHRSFFFDVAKSLDYLNGVRMAAEAVVNPSWGYATQAEAIHALEELLRQPLAQE